MKNIVDSAKNFLYYNQKEDFNDDEWKSNCIGNIHSELEMV